MNAPIFAIRLGIARLDPDAVRAGVGEASTARVRVEDRRTLGVHAPRQPLALGGETEAPQGDAQIR
jgi:hypothetical protein